MSNRASNSRRNVALIGHSGVGKTALGEAILFTAGATTRIGNTTDGSSHFDFEPEEIKRGNSLATAVFDFSYKGLSYALLDTPGTTSFIADTCTAMSGADAALLVVGAVSGFRVQGEKAWNAASRANLARAIFINEMDKERASFSVALDVVKEALEIQPIVLQLPIGEEDNFKGVVDVVSKKAYLTEDNKTTVSDIPEDMVSKVEDVRTQLIEAVAETDESLLETYLEAGELSSSDLIRGLRVAVARGDLFPVFCGSAVTTGGVVALLDAFADYFPSPAERQPYECLEEDGSVSHIDPDVEGPLVAQVFKTLADPYTGQVSLVRVVSGTLNSDETVYNSITDSDERVGKLYLQQGKEHAPVDSVSAGEIVAIVKLKNTLTGHTLCRKDGITKLKTIPLPESCISYAVEPKSKGDEDKILSAVEKIMAEDPAINISRDAGTHQTLIGGMGQNHIEITLEKIKRKFGVEMVLHAPKVPYRETVKVKAEAQGRHKKQSGGRGQFGDCWLRISPLPSGQGFKFHNEIFGGAIPRNYIPAVEKGVVEAMAGGVLAGYPIVDLECTVYDGSYHQVDSSDLAFKLAAVKGFKAAIEKARPVLLEPVMHAEIIVPDDNTGDVIGDLNSRRGKVLDMQPKGHKNVIQASVPMSEMLTYAPDLRSMTADRGSFHLEFHSYEECPAHVTKQIVDDLKKGAEHEDKAA